MTNKKVYSKDGMKSYVKNKHDRNFKCKQSKNRFTDHDNLSEHIKTIHVQEHMSVESILISFTLDCDKCEKASDDGGDLQKHIESDHVGICGNCENAFENEIALQKHVKPKHGKTMNCHQFEIFFNSQEDLESHIETHQDRSLLESTFFNPSLNDT